MDEELLGRGVVLNLTFFSVLSTSKQAELNKHYTIVV